MRNVLPIVVCILAAGCSSRANPVSDGPRADRKQQPDQAGPELALPDQSLVPDRRVDLARPDRAPGTGLACKPDKSDCRDEVVSKLILPVTDPQKYALQVGGKSYNALGAILGALSSLMGDLQSSVDGAVNAGTTILLFRFQATDFVNAAAAAGQAWIGAKASCCTTPLDKPACAAEALTTCFKGDYAFSIDPSSPKDAILGGSISAGTLSMTAPKLRLVLPITSVGVIDVELKAVQLKGTFNGLKLDAGVLAGAISKTEVQNKLIPTVATMLDTTLKSPQVAQATKDQILALFDQNKDGTVSTQEVAGNALILTFLAGDVDVDNDGEMDLSLGLGLTAVPAVIP